MLEKIKQYLDIFNIENYKDKETYYNLLKQILLGCSFFFIIGTYSVIRPLKASVFLGLVGKEYIPIAKIISIIILSPCLLIYAKLVDKLKRYQVMYFFLIFYVIGSIIASLTLMHPTIGIANTYTSKYRIFGWLFYLFIDLYSPLIVATFWAFANSINTPEHAKKNYGNIVALSRLGGMATSFGCWLILKNVTLPITTTIPAILISTSIFLLGCFFCIEKIIKKIPDEFLHGYKAVYEVEKNKKKKETGLWSGLKLMITQPYVLGIFGIVYIYEVISVITDYQMQVLMSLQSNNAIGDMSSFMFIYTASFQALGFFFAVFGTGQLLKKAGVHFCLLVMPVATGALMIALFAYPSLSTIFIVMVLLRALNYGFSAPVKEILYIPTTKDVKFKSKSWIDSFGKSLSKTSGSSFTFFSQTKNALSLIKINSLGAIALSAIWIAIAFGLGKKYTKTVDANEVIGK